MPTLQERDAAFLHCRRFSPAAAILPWVYWFYLPVRNANHFDFHPEVTLLPLFLWGLVLIHHVWKLFHWVGLFFLILTLACKETAAPILAVLGLLWIFDGKSYPQKKLIGIFFILLSSTVFYLDIQLIPKFFGGSYDYHHLYSDFGSSVFDLFLAPFLHTQTFLIHFFGPSRLHFLFLTLAPLGFLPLWGGRMLLLALPGYAMLFLTHGEERVTTIYHYAIEASVGLFAVLPEAFQKASQWFRKIPTLCIWLLFWMLIMQGKSEIQMIRKLQMQAVALPAMDPEIPISATAAIVPHLSNRNWIRHIPDLEMPNHHLVPCVIADTRLCCVNKA